MIDLEKLKEFFIQDLIEKKEMKKIYDHRHHLKKKEKKRQQIEQIKKERQENSLIFNGK